jgi:tRNA threonylcarbamoyladenosine dehydratase
VDLAIITPSFPYAEAFGENKGLLTATEQRAIASATVAIAGLDAAGASVAEVLARQGVCRFRLADTRTIAIADFNQHPVATGHGLGRQATEVVRERILSINPEADIELFGDLDPAKLDDMLVGADVLVHTGLIADPRGSVAILDRALARGLVAVEVDALGFGAAMLIGAPGGMTFGTYLGLDGHMPESEARLVAWTGLSPDAPHQVYEDPRYCSLSTGHMPGSSVGAAAAGAAAGAEALGAVLGWPVRNALPYYHQFDFRLRSWHQGWMPLGSRNPLFRWRLERGRARHGAQRAALPAPPEEGSRDSLLARASLASSFENAQPWLLTHKDGGLLVRGVAKRYHLAEASESVAGLGAGAFVEAMAVAAPSHGFDVEVATGEFAALVRLHRKLSGSERHALQDALAGPHIHHGPFRSGRLLSGALEAIERELKVKGVHGAVLHRRSEIASAAKALGGLVETRWKVQGLEPRFVSDADLGARKRGLSVHDAELSDLPRRVLKLASMFGATQALRREPFPGLLGQAATSVFHSASVLVVLAAPAVADSTTITWGRLVQRLLLLGAQHGLAGAFDPLPLVFRTISPGRYEPWSETVNGGLDEVQTLAGLPPEVGLVGVVRLGLAGVIQAPVRAPVRIAEAAAKAKPEGREAV